MIKILEQKECKIFQFRNIHIEWKKYRGNYIYIIGFYFYYLTRNKKKSILQNCLTKKRRN